MSLINIIINILIDLKTLSKKCKNLFINSIVPSISIDIDFISTSIADGPIILNLSNILSSSKENKREKEIEGNLTILRIF